MVSDTSLLPPIDLNQADVETLSTLPGIGPKLSERIIRFREEVQLFEEAVEVTAVSGISERMYRLFANQVTVSPREATEIEPSPGPLPVSEAGQEVELESRAEPPPGEEPPPEVEPPPELKPSLEVEHPLEVGPLPEGEPLPGVKPPPEAEPAPRVESPPQGVPPLEVEPLPGLEPPSEVEPPPDQPKIQSQISSEPAAQDVATSIEDKEGYIIFTDEAEAAEWERERADTGQQPDTDEQYIIQTDETEDEKARDDQIVRSSFRRSWLLMVVGALLGACLALSLIFWVNEGTLNFENHPAIRNLKADLQKQEATLTAEIKELQKQLAQYEDLSVRLQNTEAEIKILKQARDILTEQVATLENETADIATRLAALEEQTTTLDEQVATLAETSEQMQDDIDELQLNTGRFDDFLTKLRDLLLAVQGLPDSGPASPTPTPTNDTLTPTSTPLPTPTPAS
jgi:uncharacterized protein YlxW (UPF0749 family)